MPSVCVACGHRLDDSPPWTGERRVTQCPHCHAVEAAPPAGGEESLTGRTLEHRHGSVRVHERGDVLELSFSWSVWQTLAQLLVGSPVVMFSVSVARYGAGSHREQAEAPGIFGLLLLAASALFLYRMLSRLVNRTRLRLGPEGLHTSHGPLPWLGGPSLPREGVHRFQAFWRDDDATVYELVVLGTDGSRTRLLDFDDAEPAQRLARAFNAWLGIEADAAPEAPAHARATA